MEIVSPVKRNEETVEILEAYDLTGSYRAAAELAGCDHPTVRRYVIGSTPRMASAHPDRRSAREP